MSVIDFGSRRDRLEKRKEAVQEAGETLEEAIEALRTAALKIAFSDAWYEWDQGIPEGTSMCFDAELLSTCTDSAVRCLAQAIAGLEEAAHYCDE